MTKAKVTNKWLKANFNIIKICYCDLQHLLDYFKPMYYTCGIYGWNCDVYVIDYNNVICTGYRTPEGNIKFNYSIVRKYEEEAMKLYYNNNMDYQEKKRQAEKLLNDFISEVKGE